MNLKKLHRDAATIWIEKRRKEGKTNQEIYFELTKVYEGKEEIAKHIAHTLTSEQKDEYRTLNNILFIILTLSLIFNIGFGISFGKGYGDYFILIIPAIINIYFSYLVYKFEVNDYKQISKIILLSLVRYFFLIINPQHQFDSPEIITIDLIFSAIILALAAFLSTAFSSLQQHTFEKDKNGDFIVNQIPTNFSTR